jgi:hypothetical protein
MALEHVRDTLFFARIFVWALGLAAGTAMASNSSLETRDQIAVEERAKRIVAAPEVKEQIEASIRALANLPAASRPDGARLLRPAVEELAFATALDAADSDASRPKVIWIATPPRTWLSRSVPGSRWGIDNPDNVYRLIPVDGVSRYEITVRTPSAAPVQSSFFVYDSFVGEGGKLAHLDIPVGGLLDRDIKIGADGSYTITVDGTPANGRDNHIQTNADARALLVRNTFSDWQWQVPLEVSVKRLSGPYQAPLNDKKAVHLAASLLKSATETLHGWSNSGFAAPKAANVINKPTTRGGGWGFAAMGNFELADDEALVVTLDPLGAKYLGFDLANPWLVSLEHIHGSGSLNNTQAQASRDGSITYIISPKDPGVHNWLSTSGLHAGNIMIRWQELPESATSADLAIKSVKVVKLSGLGTALPADTQTVTAAQRRVQLEHRAATYEHRYGTASTVAKIVTP